MGKSDEEFLNASTGRIIEMLEMWDKSNDKHRQKQEQIDQNVYSMREFLRG